MWNVLCVLVIAQQIISAFAACTPQTSSIVYPNRLTTWADSTLGTFAKFVNQPPSPSLPFGTTLDHVDITVEYAGYAFASYSFSGRVSSVQVAPTITGSVVDVSFNGQPLLDQSFDQPLAVGTAYDESTPTSCPSTGCDYQDLIAFNGSKTITVTDSTLLSGWSTSVAGDTFALSVMVQGMVASTVVPAVPGTAFGMLNASAVLTVQYYDAELIVQTATVNGLPGLPLAIGSTLSYQLVIQNQGSAALTNVMISDNQNANPQCGDTSLGACGTVTCTGQTILTVPGSFTDTFVVNATGAAANSLTYFTAPQPINVLGLPAVTIQLLTDGSATPTGIHTNDPVTWTYVVTNRGSNDLTAVTIDQTPAGTTIQCLSTSISGSAMTVMTCSATGTAAAGSNTITATVHATVSPSNLLTSATDTNTYTATAPTSMTIDVLGNGFDAARASPPSIRVGTPITWVYVVTVYGTAGDVLSNVVVSDDFGLTNNCPTTIRAQQQASCFANGGGSAVLGSVTDHVTVTAQSSSGPIAAASFGAYVGIAAPASSSSSGTVPSFGSSSDSSTGGVAFSSSQPTPSSSQPSPSSSQPSPSSSRSFSSSAAAFSSSAAVPISSSAAAFSSSAPAAISSSAPAAFSSSAPLPQLCSSLSLNLDKSLMSNCSVVTNVLAGDACMVSCAGAFSGAAKVRVCTGSNTWSVQNPTCSDVNECATNRGGCSANAVCVNSVGTYSCQCNSGFTGNGVTCSDVNECATLNGGCNSVATCNNTVGSFSCACPPGYAGNGVMCTVVVDFQCNQNIFDGYDILQLPGVQDHPYFIMNCPTNCTHGPIWGTLWYTMDSAVCTANTHATGQSGGSSILQFDYNLLSHRVTKFPASLRYGVQSQAWPMEYPITFNLTRYDGYNQFLEFRLAEGSVEVPVQALVDTIEEHRHTHSPAQPSDVVQTVHPLSPAVTTPTQSGSQQQEAVPSNRLRQRLRQTPVLPF